mmetsp:Transcript_41307/g.129895  ORF Transcript_41307/g.129895 Transcript_41307/m.129895 type:complete len:212 (-) Transcript_41307:1898-2533(-)
MHARTALLLHLPLLTWLLDHSPRLAGLRAVDLHHLPLPCQAQRSRSRACHLHRRNPSAPELHHAECAECRQHRLELGGSSCLARSSPRLACFSRRFSLASHPRFFPRPDPPLHPLVPPGPPAARGGGATRLSQELRSLGGTNHVQDRPQPSEASEELGASEERGGSSGSAGAGGGGGGSRGGHWTFRGLLPPFSVPVHRGGWAFPLCCGFG